MVEIFDDRVDITNPGGLVLSIPKEEFGTRSFSRKSLVFGLFLRMEMVEKIGSGIKRMKDEMARANLPEPAFGLEGFFTVTFYRPMEFERWIDTWIPYLTPSLINVLKAINNNAFITKPELSEIIGHGHTSISKYTSQLRGWAC